VPGPPAKDIAVTLVLLLGKMLAKADGLLPAELLEVAMPGVRLEAVDRLCRHIERGLAAPASVLQELEVFALDALIFRAVLFHGKRLGPQSQGLGRGRGGYLITFCRAFREHHGASIKRPGHSLLIVLGFGGASCVAGPIFLPPERGPRR